MSFDLEICVLGRHIMRTRQIGNVLLHVDRTLWKAYTDTFKYMSEQKEAWCSITEIEDWCFSAMNICSITSGKQLNVNTEFPFWEEKRTGMRILLLLPEYEKSIIDAMRFTLEASPIKSIFFLPRLQGGEYNNVCGVIKFDKFLSLLKNKKILFNISYIIEL